MAIDPEERAKATLAGYIREGEQYRFFGYEYREQGQAFRTAYFFPRKKGAAFVSGFVVLDQEGGPVQREPAVRINRAFNRYNLLFKRLQNEWGDVVEQDMRKYEGVLPHFETLRPLVPDGHALKEILKRGEETVRKVLACQDRFLQLDLEAIELGKQKRESGSIDPAIDAHVENILTQFEQTLFDQYDVQAQCISVIDRFERYLNENRPPKEWKKHLKKVKRIFKRIKRLVLASEDRLKARQADPTNAHYYARLYAEWEEKVRN